jgi:two-component system sensor histidine kinase HydH
MSSAAKPFNLLRSFSLLSLVCIGTLSLASALLLSRFVTRHMLERDGVVTMQFVQSTLEALQPGAYLLIEGQTRLQEATFVDFFGREHRAQVQAVFEDFFQRLALMPEVVRANVYALDGTIIWSSYADLIGQRFTDNPELTRALSGELAIKTGIFEQHRKAEHVPFTNHVRYFAESYLPIWNNQRHAVIGVVEVYKIPDALFQAIAHGHRLMWGSSLLGGLFLYGMRFGIVRRAALLIRHQQEQLIASETMAAIGEMASAVAHNLRNPLASIRSSAEVALEEEDIGLRQQNTADIITVVDRLEGWIRELLTYARPLQHTPAPVQLHTVLQQTTQQFAKDLEQQGITLTLEVPATLPPVLADAHLLQHALHSILSNALEAMPHGGTLTITAQFTPEQHQVCIRISDTGSGIPAEQVTKVFRPFFTTKRKGLGIGLPLARRIIERHGGTITLSSTVDRGTTVTLRLPATE